MSEEKKISELEQERKEEGARFLSLIYIRAFPLSDGVSSDSSTVKIPDTSHSLPTRIPVCLPTLLARLSDKPTTPILPVPWLYTRYYTLQ